MCLVETAEKNRLNHINLKDDRYLLAIFKHYFNQAEDQAEKDWFKQAFSSYRQALTENTPLKDWLANQFAQFSIILACSTIQESMLKAPYCMSFVYNFFEMEPDGFYCDFQQSNITEKVNRYLKTFTTKTDKANLKPGDIIVYTHPQYGCTHIAVFVGRFDSKEYAVSKFGVHLDVYLHEIDNVPSNYGNPTFHHNKNASQPLCILNLARLNAQLITKLEMPLGETLSAHAALSVFKPVAASTTVVATTDSNQAETSAQYQPA